MGKKLPNYELEVDAFQAIAIKAGILVCIRAILFLPSIKVIPEVIPVSFVFVFLAPQVV